MTTSDRPGDRLRICRISVWYPTSERPDLGILELNVSRAMVTPTLLVARPAGGGEAVRSSEHVTVALFDAPDAILSGSRGLTRWVSMLVKLFGLGVFAMKSLRTIAAFRPDIIEISGLVPLPLGLLCKMLLRRPLVATIIGSDAVQVRRSRLLRFLLRWVDVICYVSPQMEDIVRDVGPRVALFTPWGIDIAQFRPGERREPIVVVVARLDQKKGHEYAVRAFSRISDRHDQARLSIVGEGPDRGRLEALVGATTGDRVHFEGALSHDAVASLLSKARVLVLPSTDDEGTPKVILEAMASGLPVIASDVGACRQLLASGCGIIVPPKDDSALAEAIDLLLGDNDLWTNMSARGRDAVAEYSWEGIADRVLGAYRSLT
jgi:glycosyltransferase involved in cell wall biosynthesis